MKNSPVMFFDLETSTGSLDLFFQLLWMLASERLFLVPRMRLPIVATKDGGLQFQP